MKVVIAPDGFSGTLSASAAARAVAAGWRRTHPGDEVALVPLSDGGEGLLDVLAAAGGPGDRLETVEVAGPHGHPVQARWLRRADGTAVIGSAEVCGLHLVPVERRTPMLATTYGVGQLLDAVQRAGITAVAVGLGGSATVDGGTGALLGLGYRLTVADGSGLKVGGDDLHRVAAAAPGWSGDRSALRVELLADVEVRLADAARVFGPQKGASPAEVDHLEAALATWAQVAERDLPCPGLAAGERLREVPGTGAAGGLGFGLAAALHARFRPGAAAVAELVGFPDALAGADLVVTGEGRLDGTSGAGKVVGHVASEARRLGVPVAGVVGQVAAGAIDLDVLEVAAPDGPGPDPAAEVAAAAQRLARRAPRPTGTG